MESLGPINSGKFSSVLSPKVGLCFYWEILVRSDNTELSEKDGRYKLKALVEAAFIALETALTGRVQL
jgi:hypothetical protein